MSERLTDEDVERVAEAVMSRYFRARYELCARRRAEWGPDSRFVCECKTGEDCPLLTSDGQRMTV